MKNNLKQKQCRRVKLTKADVLGEGTFAMSETAANDNDFIEIEIREAAKVLSNIVSEEGEIDLFHVNCEGCEWEMFENVIEHELHKKMKIIQFGTHFFQQITRISSRYCKIREELAKTHKMIWGQAFAWERWDKLN